MKSYDEIIRIKESLEEDYRDRHEAQRKLRNFWHGRYWDKMEGDSGGIASIFRDLTARQSDVGPDIKLVYNVLKDVCVKFQTFLAPLPMIRVYVDPPSSPTRKNQATIKERYLYGLWSTNNMNKVLSDHGWYLPLMGDCFLGIYPDLEANLCRTVVRSPENAYPIPSFDMNGLDGVIFSWKVRQSAIMKAFPEYVPSSNSQGGRFSFSRQKPQSSDPEVELLEYSDLNEFQRFADGQRLHGVEHSFGFNLFDHVKFINVPGEVWGHGAVEQAVNLNEMTNAYLSLMMQSAIENVFPVMVIVDPMKAPETLERGAGAVIPVNAGGKVEYLTPPSGNLLANAEWAHEIERMIKQDTSMPDVNFGVANNSIVTGKAINELQGAGTGSLVEMVQGIGIGAALTNWNEKAIVIGRTMFADDQIQLYGTETPGLAAINPRHFSFKIKGSQLVGSTRNEVVFMPYLDMHSKVVIGLQLAGGGLVTREWQREQIGIPDSEAMEEGLISETIQDAVVALMAQSIMDPYSAAQAEQEAFGYIEGDQSGAPAMGGAPPSALPGAGAPPSGGPPIGNLPGGGQFQSPPLNLPPGSPVPQQAQPQQAQSQGVALYQAISAFQQVQVSGRVFLVGEIVVRGQTADTIDVDVTEPTDRDKLSSLPFHMAFKVIPAEPNEPYVEVTPGANPIPQGQAPTTKGFE